MESDIIDRSSFPTFTQGRFEPCDVPEREPDFRSASSAYWYTDEGVTRLSDHWGTHINSCSWQLGDEPLEPCWKGKKKGQRAGRAAWKDLSTPNATIRVTHRFGELDYSKVGAAPLSTGHDPEYGDFDVFAIRREWFIDHSRFTVAGRTLSYQGGRGGGSTSALGEGYADPAAQAMSLDWEDHRLEAKERGEKADIREWAASKVSDPVYGGIARRLSGAEGAQEKQAFAVYCAADRSLRFYNREEVPQEGELFEGRAADVVYKGEAFDGHRWGELAEDVETVSVVDEGISPESTRQWFQSFERMTSCDLAKLDTSHVTSMRRMFDGCESLESLDLSAFDTARVESMASMFRGCWSLESLDLSGFDTGRVEDMEFMFCNCRSLKTLDLSGFDTGKIKSMHQMFQGCNSLKELDLSGFDTSRVENMCYMFGNCSSLETLDLHVLDTSRVEDMRYMFYGCDKLPVETIDPALVVAADAAHALVPEKVSSLPLYRADDGERALDLSIAALERRAQDFPADWRGWIMRGSDGYIHVSKSLDGLLEGVKVLSIDDVGGDLLAYIVEYGIGYNSEIRILPSLDADWDECEPPHAGRWAAGLGEPMQWVIGACPTEAELVGAGAAQAGILRADAMGVARAASVDAAVSMMSKGADGAAVVYRDLAFAPASDGTWTVMKQSAEGSSFSPFEAGWRPGALSFDEQAAAADVAKMEAATPGECAAGRWAEVAPRAAEAPEKAAPSKRAQAPAKADPALLATADARGSSSRGAR